MDVISQNKIFFLHNFWKRCDRIKFTEKSNLARVEKPKPNWATVGNAGHGKGLTKKPQFRSE